MDKLKNELTPVFQLCMQMSSAADKPGESASHRRRFFKSVGVLRQWFLRLWKRRVEMSFHSWFHSTEHVCDRRDNLWACGEEAIQRAKNVEEQLVELGRRL